jgi:hypothetical protein
VAGIGEAKISAPQLTTNSRNTLLIGSSTALNREAVQALPNRLERYALKYAEALTTP